MSVKVSDLKLVSENFPFPVLTGFITSFPNGIIGDITVNTVGQPNVTVELLQLVSAILPLMCCRIGPAGSAVCAYRADNSLTPQGSGGTNRGIFDIFRSDIEVVNPGPPVTTTEEENRFVEVRYTVHDCFVIYLSITIIFTTNSATQVEEMQLTLRRC